MPHARVVRVVQDVVFLLALLAGFKSLQWLVPFPLGVGITIRALNDKQIVAR